MRAPQSDPKPWLPGGSGVGIGGFTLNTVCEVCGDIGYKRLLVCCRDCKCSVVHLYCLDKIVFDALLAEWLCYECLQRHGEVTCSRSLEKEEGRCQLDYRASNELAQRSISANVTQPSILRKYAAEKVIPFSPGDNCEKVLPCPGFQNTPTVRERSVDSIDLSSSSQHDTTESSESSEGSAECRTGSYFPRGKTIKIAAASSSCKSSGEGITSANDSSESDDLQTPPRADYVLSYRTYLSDAQKERVIAFIQEIQPETTVFVANMQKRNVQPPGPFLGISKEYASAHFPHKSTNVTLQMPGKRRKWHPKFYKRNASRKNMLMGQWLGFIRDNHVQEGDICLLFPTDGGKRSTFMVYLLCATATHSIGGAGFQRACACPGTACAKMDSGVRIMKEPSNDEYISLETDMHEISRESLESEDSSGPCQPAYIVPCRNSLSKSQKKIVEKRVQAIKCEVPICVAVMKNNNVGDAQKWMLELGVRYAAVYLPASGQTVVPQCTGKTWETQMVIHNGRRWFLNGGWAKFARDNGLQVGDICLFELKKNERKLSMKVHIISREQFSLK